MISRRCQAGHNFERFTKYSKPIFKELILAILLEFEEKRLSLFCGKNILLAIFSIFKYSIPACPG
jgi:hypothetical protein